MSMRCTFGLTLALTAVLALAAGIATSGASTKFAHTAEIADTGKAVVHFEEGSLKRFDVVHYQLDATATSLWVSSCGGQLFLHQSFPTAAVALVPDAKGRVNGTLTLELEMIGAVCPALRQVEYTSVTLTNLTTGHVYRLDPVSREFP